MQNNRKFNAIKHGLLSKQLVLEEGETRGFNKLARLIIQELDPQNALESIMAEQVVIQYWRLKRFLQLENELIFYAGKPKSNLDKDQDYISLFNDFLRRNDSLELVSRYNASILKSFYRAINEYKALKH
jgi:hypothetical protein